MERHHGLEKVEISEEEEEENKKRICGFRMINEEEKKRFQFWILNFQKILIFLIFF